MYIACDRCGEDLDEERGIWRQGSLRMFVCKPCAILGYTDNDGAAPKFDQCPKCYACFVWRPHCPNRCPGLKRGARRGQSWEEIAMKCDIMDIC